VPFPLLLLAAALSHSPWQETLQRFVTPQARVDYAALNKQGLPTLDAYLATLAQPFPRDVSRDERKAALINAYNALTVRWVAAHYPIPSIWRTKHPFTEVRHTVDGRKYSLDQIETELRDMGDPRVHAVLVCAARSCPPLRREAYVAERLDAQLTANTLAWLSNPALTEFDPTAREAEVSQIFEWYGSDFGASPWGLLRFLSTYGPPHAKWMYQHGSGKRLVRYREYYWGLNDAGTAGDAYGYWSFRFDYLRNKYL
jgi:hypothetical protein